MPKGFTDAEKERIISLLRREGERLFVQYGLKKVTIENLAQAAQIAKGSFYSFYSSKEELYMDILDRCQRRMYEELEVTLATNRNRGKQLMREVIRKLLQSMERFPLILRTDQETIELLYRKLSPKVLEEHLSTDTDLIENLMRHGVQFVYPPVVVAKCLQQAVLAGFQMDQDDPDRAQVMLILLEGVVEKLVRDEE
ncbi:MAG: TetR/AcrR family transcriptional regulator [Firmicutes bacterium]|nr:TetR/AcrR family transcriptional regulator [Bacillota bacterium]